MFNIIESTMGFAGDVEIEIIEAKTPGIAETEKYEVLCEQVEATCIESFNTQEEADNWIEEMGYV